MKTEGFITALLIFNIAFFCYSLDNGLGITPQMGWNSWNHFGCNINEQIIRETTDALISSGLAAKGYNYVNIDDCWNAKKRDPVTKKQVPDPTNFPNGMKAVGDYIHSKGLNFGIYSDAGFFTCQIRPGSLHHEEIDAQSFAEWGVDYLKYDNCYNDLSSPKKRYPIMRDALNKTGRPIFFSMCEWGRQNPATWAKEVGNSWRTTGDIKDTWSSFTSILDKQVGLESYSGPGGWNDPDMLEVGNGGMTLNEYKAHFAFWALLKAPLIIGNDVRNMPQEVMDIIGNEELISVNQDPLGIQGKRYIKKSGYENWYGKVFDTICSYLCPFFLDIEVWAGPLKDNQHIIILFNRGSKTEKITANFNEIGIKYNKANVRDFYAKKDIGIFENNFSADVESHSAIVIKVTPVN